MSKTEMMATTEVVSLNELEMPPVIVSFHTEKQVLEKERLAKKNPEDLEALEVAVLNGKK